MGYPTTMIRCAFLFIFLSTFFMVSLANIRYTKIRNENESFFFLDIFKFRETGVIEVNVSHIELSPNPTDLNLSTTGFFITPRKEFLDVHDRGTTAECYFDTDLSVEKSVTTLFTYDKLPSKGRNILNIAYNITYPGEFLLFFQNCLPQLQLSMDVRSAMYNLNERTGSHRNYLSDTRTYQIWFYPALISAYLVLSAIWFCTLFVQRLKLSGLFTCMLLALMSKLISLMFQLVEICYLYKSGDTQSWTVFFFALIPTLSPEIPFLLMSLFIYSGWRNKLFVKTIMSLQILVIIYKILTFTNGPWGIYWGLNMFFFRFMNICIIGTVRYCTCEWAIRHLKLGGRVEGKAAMNLRKKEMVQSLAVALYIYQQFTIFLSIFSEVGLCPWLLQHVWKLVALHELAELAVFMFMERKLWPELRCKFIVFTDDEEKTAAETLSKVVQWCILEADYSTDETPYDPFGPLKWCGTGLGLIRSP